MRNPISSLLGSLLICAALATHIGTTYPEVLVPMTDWLLHRPTFTLALCAISALIGVLLIVSGRRGTVAFSVATTLKDPILSFYASAAGSVLGWVIGASIAALIENHQKYWPLALVLPLWTFLFFIGPLVVANETHKAMHDFSGRWFRAKWKQFVLNVVGWVALLLAVVGAFVA